MRRLFCPAVLLVTLTLATCAKAPSPTDGAAPTPPAAPGLLVVSGVRVTDLTAPDERPEGYVLPDVAAWAEDELARATTLRLAKDSAAGAPAISLALLYGVVSPERQATRDPLAGAVLTAGVQANLGMPVPGEPPLAFQAERLAEQALTEADAAGFGATLSRQLEGLSRAAVRQLDRKVALHRGDQAALIAALDDPDDALVEYAATLVGERGHQGAVPKLLERLKSPTLAVRLRAIGALGQLKAVAAVAPLADLAGQAKHPREIAAAILGLADIGGPEARRYLEGLRASTPIDDVRKLVDQALSRPVP
jgi:hypothetical protein